MTRDEAIQDLREMLLTLVDDERSVCRAVAENGGFCGGFARWSLDELRARFPRIAEDHPNAHREEFEEFANRALLARQFPELGRLPCDLFALREESCAGWKGFSNADLARSYARLFGIEVEVVPG